MVAVPVATEVTLQEFTCPAGKQAGDTIRISTEAGQFDIVVPKGVSSGMPFQVQLPAAAGTTTVVGAVRGSWRD